ncbi:hypothetical protein K501DRAFT_277647 [Backusella circina FSU 941]|nr:hypothetical protein K501DRAFT_277647 [Backusella circina FSU 941]
MQFKSIVLSLTMLSAVFAGIIPITLISSSGKGGDVLQDKSENLGNQGNVGFNPNIAAKNIAVGNDNAIQLVPQLNAPFFSHSHAEFGDTKQDADIESHNGDYRKFD